MALSVALAALLFSRDGVSCFSAAFSNAGFIGIPLVQSVLGGDAAFLISAMIVMIGLLQYTVGLFMITGDRGKMKAGAVLKNPVVLSVALGVLLYAANIPKPALAVSLFSTVGSINTPLVMLLLGAYLAKDKSKTSFCRHLKLWGLLCAAVAFPGSRCATALWQRANESLRLSGGKPGRHFSPEIWRGL